MFILQANSQGSHTTPSLLANLLAGRYVHSQHVRNPTNTLHSAFPSLERLPHQGFPLPPLVGLRTDPLITEIFCATKLKAKVDQRCYNAPQVG